MSAFQIHSLFQKKQVYLYFILFLFCQGSAQADPWQTGNLPVAPPQIDKKEPNRTFTPNRSLPHWDRYEGASKEKKNQKKPSMYANKKELSAFSLCSSEVSLDSLQISKAE